MSRFSLNRVFGRFDTKSPAPGVAVPQDGIIFTDSKNPKLAVDPEVVEGTVLVEQVQEPMKGSESLSPFQAGQERLSVPTVANLGAPVISVEATPQINFSTPLDQKAQKEADQQQEVLVEATPEAESVAIPVKPVEVTEDEEKLHDLLKNLKNKPVAERREDLSQIAALKNGDVPVALNADKVLELRERVEREQAAAVAQAEKIKAEKEKVGLEILKRRNAIERIKGDLEAIAQDVLLLDRQITERETTHVATKGRAGGKKKGEQNVDAVLARLQKDKERVLAQQQNFTERLQGSEAAYQEAVNAYLAIPDATDTEIQELIRENIEPVVVTDDTVVIEPSEISQEIAAEIPAAALGLESLPEQPELMAEKIESEGTLDERIALAREAYVEKDIETTSHLKRLARSFTWIKPEEAAKNGDVQALRERYQSLLAEKKAGSLVELQGLTGEAREQMALQLSKYFLVDEQAALALAYQAREKETLSNKLEKIYQGLGEWYNRQPLGRKIAVGAGLFGSSVALAATGGSIAGIAVGAVAVRRFIAGAGSAVALDAFAEKLLANREEKKVNKKIEDALYEASQESTQEDFAKRIEEFLEAEEKGLDQQIAQKRVKTLFRKWSARIVGGAGGYLAHLVAEGFHEAPQVETGKMEGGVAAGPLEQSSGLAPAAAPEIVPEEGAAVPPEAGRVPSIPTEYVLTQTDGARGLWGVLEKNMPLEGLDAEQKGRAISSMKNLIATKLEALSPEEKAAAGFRSGSIETIYAGDTLHLQELVTEAEMKEIIGGKIIDAPVTSLGEQLPDIDVAHVEGIDSREVSEQITSGADLASSVSDVEDIIPQDDVREMAVDSLVENRGYSPGELLAGEMRGQYIERVAGMRQALFQTPETNNWPKYSYVLHRELGRVTMDQIKEAQALLADGSSTNISNSLHASQIARMSSFTEKAVSVYGDAAQPKVRETLEAYTSRIAALGFRPGADSINLNQITKSV